MGYEKAHAPIYGYMKGHRHTIPLHLVHYARTLSIFKLLNTLDLGRVLNVGGADGYHSVLVERLFGAPVVTLDLDAHRMRLARGLHGLDACQGSALDIPFADASFDTVLCIETIEHIDEPARVVDELKRVAARNVVVSTESFYDSEEQKAWFRDYLRETHPRFFRANDPVRPADVSHFTADDFRGMFGTGDLGLYGQFSYKQREIVGDIETVRAHVLAMTEGLEPGKRSKIVVHFAHGSREQGGARLPVRELVEAVVGDEPLVPIRRDDEMRREDGEARRLAEAWHGEKGRCAVVRPGEVPALDIAEPGARGMTLRWLTADDDERSPRFCMRSVRLEPGGATPRRANPWEHQLYVLAGSGALVEDGRETPLEPGMAVLVREGVGFTVRNEGDGPLEYLDMVPSITQFFGR